MSMFLKWLGCGLCVAFVVALCVPTYAVSISTVGYTADGTLRPGATYGAIPWDYYSLPDGAGYKAGVLNNILGGLGNAGVSTAQGGATLGLGPPWTIGLAETFTPRSAAGNDYGAYNDHGFQLETVAVPVSGGNANLTGTSGVTMRIYQPTLTGTGGLHGSDSGFANGAGIFSTQFDWTNDGTAKMLTINLMGTGPVLAVDTTYALAFEWDVTSTDAGQVNNNSFVWYRLGDGSTADEDTTGGRVPSGMGYRMRNTTEDYITITASGGAGGAPRTYGMALSSLAVPEPGTLALMGLAVPALVLAARRRRKC